MTKARPRPEEIMDCTVKCARQPRCTLCGRRKAPRGRSVAAEVVEGFCMQAMCSGYDQEPTPGHLWPEELKSMGFLNDGPPCPVCGEDTMLVQGTHYTCENEDSDAHEEWGGGCVDFEYDGEAEEYLDAETKKPTTDPMAAVL